MSIQKIRLMTAALSLVATAFVTGCAHREPPLYQWGSYEDLVYDMYVNPGKAEPGVQIERLTEDIQRAQAEGQRVPPGVHAHLGYMHFVQGNQGEALHEFATERELYPESAVFIDGMMNRLKNNQANN
jgi:hypothetical protein